MYAERFAENDIDFTLLPELTDQDLEKIGVASLGHRRRILKAIAALERTPAAATPADPASEAFARLPKHSLAAAPPIASADAVGEPRYLTLMFCDLVGSTAISAQLDAKEWRDLVGAYLDAASASEVRSLSRAGAFLLPQCSGISATFTSKVTASPQKAAQFRQESVVGNAAGGYRFSFDVRQRFFMGIPTKPFSWML